MARRAGQRDRPERRAQARHDQQQHHHHEPRRPASAGDLMGLFFAWMIGESIVFYRWGKLHAPPTPGVLASSSIVFGALAVASLYQPAKTAATVAAFTYDLAILMQVVGK